MTSLNQATFHPPGFIPPPRRRFRVNRRTGRAASVAIWMSAVATVGHAGASGYLYYRATSYEDGTGTLAAVEHADALTRIALFVQSAVTLVAGVVFVIWLWRARTNAEYLCDARHRHSRGWAIGGWICPVVSFWYPKEVVDDVVAASDPYMPARGARLTSHPGTSVARTWWGGWLAMLLAGYVSNAPAADTDGLFVSAGLSVSSAAAGCICAVQAVRLIGMVDRVQLARRRSPWWTLPPG